MTKKYKKEPPGLLEEDSDGSILLCVLARGLLPFFETVGHLLCEKVSQHEILSVVHPPPRSLACPIFWSLVEVLRDCELLRLPLRAGQR